MALMLMEDLDTVLGEIARVLTTEGLFGAIIGGPPAPDDAFAIYVELCRAATERGEIDRLPLGDRRLGSAESINQLFAHAGLEASMDDDWLTLDTDIDGVWASLSTTYDVAWMSQATRTRVEHELRHRAIAITRPNGSVPFRVPARRIVARAARG